MYANIDYFIREFVSNYHYLVQWFA